MNVSELYKSGDKVLVFKHQYGQTNVEEGVVFNVSRTGQITVRLLVNGLPSAAHSYRFTPRGKGYGSDSWQMRWLEPPTQAEEHAAELMAEQRKKVAALVVRDIVHELQHNSLEGQSQEWWLERTDTLRDAVKHYYTLTRTNK